MYFYHKELNCVNTGQQNNNEYSIIFYCVITNCNKTLKITYKNNENHRKILKKTKYNNPQLTVTPSSMKNASKYKLFSNSAKFKIGGL